MTKPMARSLTRPKSTSTSATNHSSPTAPAAQCTGRFCVAFMSSAEPSRLVLWPARFGWIVSPARKLLAACFQNGPQATGCSRTWGCVCTSASRGALTACPFHSAAALLGHRQTRFATTGSSLPADLPLFPGRDGGWCSRDGFLGAIAELARRLSACTTDSLGRNIVGEHTWRVSGSCHLASLDVPLPIIRLLARWGGDTIMRYVQDAPLSSLTRLYLDRVAAADGAVRGIAAAAQATASSASPTISPVLTPAESASAFAVDPLLDADVPEPLVSPPFFRRAGPRTKVHMVSLPPRLGVKGDQLPCGRQYTESGVFSSAVPINLPLCDKCGSLRLWATAMAIASSIIPADSA